MLKLQTRPFIVPNFITVDKPPTTRQEGCSFAVSFPLSAVDADHLSDMCDEFRAKIFEKAGKKDPKEK